MKRFTDEFQNVYTPVFESSKKPGTFHNGKLLGYGKLQYANGDQYTGSFKSGLRSGEGVMLYKELETEKPEDEKKEKDQFFTSSTNEVKTDHFKPDSGRYEGEWKGD